MSKKKHNKRIWIITVQAGTLSRKPVLPMQYFFPSFWNKAVFIYLLHVFLYLLNASFVDLYLLLRIGTFCDVLKVFVSVMSHLKFQWPTTKQSIYCNLLQVVPNVQFCFHMKQLHIGLQKILKCHKRLPDLQCLCCFVATVVSDLTIIQYKWWYHFLIH